MGALPSETLIPRPSVFGTVKSWPSALSPNGGAVRRKSSTAVVDSQCMPKHLAEKESRPFLLTHAFGAGATYFGGRSQ